MSQAIFSSHLNDNEKIIGRQPPQALIRKALARAGVLAVRIVGSPGSGKTELIEATLRRLAAPRRMAVIVINPAAQRDAARLGPCCGYVQAIDASVPRAAAIWNAVQKLPLQELDMILIEACGGLAPLEDLGQNATVAVFAVSGGDDKAAEYSGLLSAASAVLVTKTDLESLVKFNHQVFRKDLHAINPTAEVFEVSTVNGSGFTAWRNWMEGRNAAKAHVADRLGKGEQAPTDKFIG